jgi:hypothetical protein
LMTPEIIRMIVAAIPIINQSHQYDAIVVTTASLLLGIS